MANNPFLLEIRNVETVTAPQAEAELRAFEALERADLEHRAPRAGHAIADERGTPSGYSCVRQACSCGWKGAWFRAL